MKRVVTALLLLPIAFYGIFFAPQPVFIAIVLAFAAFCYHEFTTIAAAHGVTGPLWIGHLTGLAIAASADTIRLSTVLVLALALGMKDLPKVLPFVASAVLGPIYVYGAWNCAIPLREVSPYWVFFALALNWAGDSAAFYVGRKIGKHKLFPRVSPGKSWEGAGASMLGAVVFGAVLQMQGLLQVSLPEIVALAAVANIAGQVGDLVESAMKRGAGMKDSGTLLGAHGGFLDRFDSSLFTMPIVYYFLQYRGIVWP